MEQTRSQVARAILDYFAKHPDAQDTLSGIAHWWLTDETVKTRTVTIKEALDDLIADGFVLAQRGKDSQIRYRVNEQRLDEVEKLLKQASETSVRANEQRKSCQFERRQAGDDVKD